MLGYVVTNFDPRDRICAEALQKIQEMFGEVVFETVIRTNVKLQTAPAFRKSIYEHAPDSHGSKDYEALTDEMLGRLKMNSTIRAVEARAK